MKITGNGGRLCGLWLILREIEVKDFKRIVGFEPKPGGQILLNIEIVSLIVVGKVSVKRMFRDIVFQTIERPDTTKLQYALAAIHHGKLID